MLSMMFIILPRAAVSADRIADVLETELSIKDPEKPKKLAQPFRGNVEFRNVSFRYPGAEADVIHDISFTAKPGETTAFVGSTGSGKSTAIQHLSGLLRADGGKVVVFDQDMAAPATDVRAIRRRVGLVFQLPEAQLFEQYVGDDVAYGPRKLGLSREEVRARVRRAMEAVGLPFEEFKDRVTFRLSGGQMRRAALAGVLALEPEVLVLDEPTAGLDPQARRQLMERIVALHDEGITLVIISHNMEELAEICDRLYVLADGRTVMEGAPAAIFSQASALREDLYRRLAGHVMVVPSLLERQADIIALAERFLYRLAADDEAARFDLARTLGDPPSPAD